MITPGFVDQAGTNTQVIARAHPDHDPFRTGEAGSGVQAASHGDSQGPALLRNEAFLRSVGPWLSPWQRRGALAAGGRGRRRQRGPFAVAVAQCSAAAYITRAWPRGRATSPDASSIAGPAMS